MHRRRYAPLLLLAALTLGVLGCRKQSTPDAQPSETPPEPVAKKSFSVEKPEPPVDLVRIEESAYGAFLSFVGENLIVAASAGIHFITPGEPPHFHACATGTHRALVGDDLVYYEAGRFFVQPVRGGARRSLLEEPQEPKSVAGSERTLAWIIARDGRQSLKLRVDGKVATVHETEGSLLTLTVDRERVSFVEGAADGSWRVGAVDLATKKVRLGPLEHTRSPASLAASSVPYYYDGPKREVRRLTAAFDATEVVASEVICSPLTVLGERVFCAEVGGLAEVGGGRAPRVLSAEVRGPIAHLAVNETHLAWLEDGGRSTLLARVLELPR